MNEIIKLARAYHDVLSWTAYWRKWLRFALFLFGLYLLTVAAVTFLVINWHAYWLALAVVPFVVAYPSTKSMRAKIAQYKRQSICDLYGFEPANLDEAHEFFLKHYLPSVPAKEYLSLVERIERFQRVAQQSLTQSPMDEKGFLGMSIGLDAMKKIVTLPFLLATLAACWQGFLLYYNVDSTTKFVSELTTHDALTFIVLFAMVFMLSFCLIMIYKMLAEIVHFCRIQFTESEYADQAKINAFKSCLIRYAGLF